MNGFYIAGICKGVRQTEKTNTQTGEIIRKYFVGLAVPNNNGYEGQETILEVEFSKNSIANNDMAQFNEKKGQHLTVPINSMSRAYKERVYTNNYYDPRRELIQNTPMLSEKQLKEVVNK